MRRKTPNKEKYNLELVKTMPPLHHTQPGQKYDPEKSDLLKWIGLHYEFLQMIFGDIANSGYIKYNPRTGTWQGVDYHE